MVGVGVVVDEPDGVTVALGDGEDVPAATGGRDRHQHHGRNHECTGPEPTAVHGDLPSLKGMADNLRRERWDIDATSSPHPGMGASIG